MDSMEVLIAIVLFGLVVYLFPYILAGIAALFGVAVLLVSGVFVLLKKMMGR
jgi:hypothetical protein